MGPTSGVEIKPRAKFKIKRKKDKIPVPSRSDKNVSVSTVEVPSEDILLEVYSSWYVVILSL